MTPSVISKESQNFIPRLIFVFGKKKKKRSFFFFKPSESVLEHMKL